MEENLHVGETCTCKLSKVALGSTHPTGTFEFSHPGLRIWNTWSVWDIGNRSWHCTSFLINRIKLHRMCESEAAQLCPTLCDLVDCSLPRSPLHGVFQARVLEWAAISYSNTGWVGFYTGWVGFYNFNFLDHSSSCFHLLEFSPGNFWNSDRTKICFLHQLWWPYRFYFLIS